MMDSNPVDWMRSMEIECRRRLAEIGPGAYVQLMIRRPPPRRWDRCRAWRGGPLGRCIGESEREWMWDGKAADVLAALWKGGE